MKSCIACKDVGKYHEANNPHAVFCGQFCQRIHHYIAIGGKPEKRSREEEPATTLEDYSRLPPDIKSLLMEYAPSLKELERWCQKDRESAKLCRDPHFQIKWAKAHKETLHKEIEHAFMIVDNNKYKQDIPLLKQWLLPAIRASAWNDYELSLQYAAAFGYLDLVRFIVGLPGVDPAFSFNLPIRSAAENGHLEIVQFLASLPGVDPADSDSDALRSAAYRGHFEVVRFLGGLPGVDPSAVNNDAIRSAAENGHLEIVQFLASLPGVNPAARDNSPIRWAAKKGHFEVVRYLLSLDRVRQTLSNVELQEFERMVQ